ncbi:hypothetical protein NP233_g10116 [Leucocoprinus birnbaumii]|uniref:Uncharacterized protein n=1 Tax=Leucocoprinus birnbaumii TaxID=56174 RepID=A0AAD5VJ63_9AGAR|nr:hypothetical protein NP233_g10116 [Leucocoprinus birnbaumii]
MYVYQSTNRPNRPNHPNTQPSRSSRTQPVNLKERIAALQQHSSSSSSSSSPSSTSTNHSPNPNHLREKIARFEKKGGIPVPRGSFGLGGPPPTDSTDGIINRKRGELYGNRIPQPVRVVSGPQGVQQRTVSPLGFNRIPGAGSGASGTPVSLGYGSGNANANGSGGVRESRRSFSLSSFGTTTGVGEGTELDTGSQQPQQQHEEPEEIVAFNDVSGQPPPPITPPTPSSPPESPRRGGDGSAPSSTVSSPRRHTSSFATALEFARAKGALALQDSFRPPVPRGRTTSDVGFSTGPGEADAVGTTASREDSSATSSADSTGADLPAVSEENQHSSVPSSPTHGTTSLPSDADTPATLSSSPQSQPDMEDEKLTITTPAHTNTTLHNTHDNNVIQTSSNTERDVDADINSNTRSLSSGNTNYDTDAPTPPPQPVATQPESNADVVVSSPSLSTSSLAHTHEEPSPSPGREPEREPEPEIASPSSTHKLLLRAAGLGSPLTPAETSAIQQSQSFGGSLTTPSIVLSEYDEDGEGENAAGMVMGSPVVGLGVALGEPEVDDVESEVADEVGKERGMKKGPPPMLALDGVMLPASAPTIGSDTLPSSQLESRAPTVQVDAENEAPSSPTTPIAPTMIIPSTSSTQLSPNALSPPLPPAPSSPSSTKTPSSPPSPSLYRPVSMLEFTSTPSPSHVAFAQRVTPHTERGMPMTLSPPSATHTRSSRLRSNEYSDEEDDYGTATDDDGSTADANHIRPIPLSATRTPIRLTEYQQQQQEKQQVFREGAEAQGEPGSVRIITSSYGGGGENSFKAVVHRKIREPQRPIPGSTLSLLPPPRTTMRRVVSAIPLGATDIAGISNQKPGFLPMVPASPGFGDLTDLLQSTVLLEERLENGVFPESPRTPGGVPWMSTGDDDNESSIEVRRLSREELEENRRTLWKIQAKREEQAKSKMRNGFLRNVASSKDVGGSSRDAMYYDGSQHQQQMYSKRFKSPSVPHLLESVPDNGPYAAAGVGNAAFRSKTPDAKSSKSSKSRFNAFRRLTNRSSPSKEGHGNGPGRSSVSTSSEFSSEDSGPSAITPPDGTTEFGGLSQWPNMTSPGKGRRSGGEKEGPMARAATFAGKIWQRTRTKSGASTLSSHSSHGRMSTEPPPALPPLPKLILNDPVNDDMLGRPPARTTSLIPRSSSTPSLPPLPSKNPDLSFSFEINPSRSSTPQPSRVYNTSGGLSPLSPDSPSSLYASSRKSRTDTGTVSSSLSYNFKRDSWSSSGSQFGHSSVLDSELFDAFPSVPENHPMVPPHSNRKYASSYSPTSSNSPSPSSSQSPAGSIPFLPSPQRSGGSEAQMQSFDGALMSSAAHLGAKGQIGGAGGGFLSPLANPGNVNSAGSSDVEGFLPLVSPYSPPESAQTVGNGWPAGSRAGNGGRPPRGVPPPLR